MIYGLKIELGIKGLVPSGGALQGLGKSTNEIQGRNNAETKKSMLNAPPLNASR